MRKKVYPVGRNFGNGQIVQNGHECARCLMQLDRQTADTPEFARVLFSVETFHDVHRPLSQADHIAYDDLVCWATKSQSAVGAANRFQIASLSKLMDNLRQMRPIDAVGPRNLVNPDETGRAKRDHLQDAQRIIGIAGQSQCGLL